MRTMVDPRTRPAPRWCHASTGLDDFAIITWSVDPARVEALLPAGFEADVRNGAALISMVAFLDDRFFFRGAPFVKVSCGQVNYRAYARRGSERGVWFFGTSLDSRFVALPQFAWKMPWHRDHLHITSEWGEDLAAPSHCRAWRLDAEGGWGGGGVTLRGSGEVLDVPDGFTDAGEASRVVFDPFVGWYARRDGSGIGRYSVWHEPLALERAIVDRARCDVFTNLGLVEDGQMPVWAGLQRRVMFDVHTPPVRA